MGRRWITCDTSRVATDPRQTTADDRHFDYYQLAYPDEGVGSGFQIQDRAAIFQPEIFGVNEPPATETLYDQPLKDTKNARVTGPFTVEAVPAPMVLSIDQVRRTAGRGPGGLRPPMPQSPAPARPCVRMSGAMNCCKPASAANPDSTFPFRAWSLYPAAGYTPTPKPSPTTSAPTTSPTAPPPNPNARSSHSARRTPRWSKSKWN